MSNHGSDHEGDDHEPTIEEEINRAMNIINQFLQEQQDHEDIDDDLNITQDNQEEKLDAWGHSCTDKLTNTLRLGFVNINGLQIKNRKNYKQKLNNIIKLFLDKNIDMIGLAEVNTDWKKVPYSSTPHKIFKNCFKQFRCKFSHNTLSDTTDISQPGGTMLLHQGDTIFKAYGKGLTDHRSYGRWTIQQVRGKRGEDGKNIITNIIAAYRPSSIHSPGEATNYFQQATHLISQEDSRCPRDVFLEDLEAMILTHQANGEETVLMGDFNEYTNSQRMQDFLASTGLRDVLREAHPNSESNTYVRGSKPIDGIFCSDGIKITQGGYLHADEVHTDHKLLWIDIHFDNIFGRINPKWIHPTVRRLQYDNPVTKEKYTTTLQTLYEFFDYDRKKAIIDANVEADMLTYGEVQDSTQIAIDTLDNERTSWMEKAESSCRKLKMGAVPWSLEWQQLTDRRRLLKIILRRRRGMSTNSRQLKKLLRRTSWFSIHTLTNEELQEELKNLNVTIRRYKKEGDEKRMIWLENLAQIIANHEDKPYEEVFQRLSAREKIRNMYRRIKWATGTTKTKSPLLSVGIPTASDPRLTTTLLEQEPIERACLDEARSRFCQAQHTPFATEQSRTAFGVYGESPLSQRILEGLPVDDDEDIDAGIRRLLQFFKKPDSLTDDDAIDMKITYEEYKEGWKRMNHNTAAGLSGITYCMLKTSASHEFLGPREAAFATLLYSKGIILTRWKHVLNVLIAKRVVSTRVEGLRIICLFEADYNFMNKVLARKVMKSAEKHKVLAEAQYGSRKHRSAQQQCLNKRLVLDILRQSRQPYAYAAIDAKSCYDRIDHISASLFMQQVGCSIPVVRSVFLTLQHMIHHVKTGFGVSEFFWDSGLDEWLSQTIGQGNGGGPMMWAGVSSILLNAMKHEGFEVDFESPLSDTIFSLPGFIFVDDADLFQTDPVVPSLHNATERLQDMLDKWGDNLRVTGGALVPTKSSVQLVDFSWKHGIWSVSSDELDVFLFDHNGDRIKLKQMDVDTGIEGLGNYISPSGDSSTAKQHMMDKSLDFASYIRKRPLKYYQLRIAFARTLCASHGYRLPALLLDKPDTYSVIRPALQATLQKLNIVSTLPRDLVFGHRESLGLHLPDPYVEAHSTAIELVGLALLSNSGTGKLLQISIDKLQLEIGSGSPFWTLPHEIYHQVLPPKSHYFCQRLWAFIDKHGIELNIKVNIPPTSRHLDRSIIDECIEFAPTKSWKAINRCAKWLRVFWLSDITDDITSNFTTRTSKQAIQPWAYKGAHSNPHASGSWPYQGKPSNNDWGHWRRFIKTITRQERGRRIFLQPIAGWKFTYPDNWEWFYNPATRNCFQHIEDGFWRYQRVASHATRANLTRIQLRNDPPRRFAQRPPNCIPCIVSNIEGTNYVTGLIPVSTQQIALHQGPNPHIVDTWKPSWTEHEDKDFIISAYGSFYDATKRAGSAIIVRDWKALYYSTPGDPTYMNNFRSELFAQCLAYQWIATFKDLGHEFNSIRIDYDCEPAYDHSRIDVAEFKFSMTDFDITAELLYYRARATTGTSISWLHVPSHDHDDVRDIYSLPTEFFLNQIADTYARLGAEPVFQPWVLQHVPISVKIRGETISSSLRTNLSDLISFHRAEQYWIRKQIIPQEGFLHICTSSLQQALHQDASRGHIAMKLLSGFSAAASQQQKYGLRMDTTCRSCNEHDHSRHCLQCSDPILEDKRAE